MNPFIQNPERGHSAWFDNVQDRLEAWRRDNVGARIWSRDHTVWSATPVPELADRLGWLGLPRLMRGRVADLAEFADEVRGAGTDDVVLLGMGGSSLAPEVCQATFGRRSGFPRLHVLDSTHPSAVRAVERRLDLGRTLFLVSSKSGTTSETSSFLQYFWSRYGPAEAGRHFVAITDPGTPLEQLACGRGFRRTFSAPPDVGGRYSALSVFGLVPAALIGVDLGALLDSAWKMAEASGPHVVPRDNPSLVLGAAIGELALSGRDKLTFFVSSPFETLPAWLEQLIAESTGKHGRGIVPVADEPVMPARLYGQDRVFVSLEHPATMDAAPGDLLQELAGLGHPVIRLAVPERADLGQEFFRWELATAAAGAVLGIQPFDQPDVQLAKEMARRAMVTTAEPGEGARATLPLTEPADFAEAVATWLAQAVTGDYVAVQAYLAPTSGLTSALQGLRAAIGRRAGLATTLGYGPRFLHSTGQLHKGGSNTGLFLQLVDEPVDDLPVPEASYSFGQLIAAQAAGDAMALTQRGRRLLRLGLGREQERTLEALAVALNRA